MTDKLFNKIWKDALEQPNKELYMAEYGYPDWFDEISQDPQEISDILGNIHEVAHMTLKEIIKRAGLTQAAFSVKFCIPIRTVEDWCSGKNKCRDYDRLMFCKILGILKV